MSAYIDVIVFAVIAAALLWRLSRVLGQRTENDPPSFTQQNARPGASRQNDPYSVAATQKNVEAALASLPSHVIAQSPTNWSANLPNYDIVANATAHHRLTPFLAVDPTFYPDDFIAKARKAFPAIVNAFGKGDKRTLEFLLAPSLYSDFAAAIDKRANDNEQYDVQVRDVKKALITDARLDGTVATVTVDFTAEQAITHKAANGNVINGEDGHVETTKDRWVFSKDLKSADPKWTLVKTQEID